MMQQMAGMGSKGLLLYNVQIAGWHAVQPLKLRWDGGQGMHVEVVKV